MCFTYYPIICFAALLSGCVSPSVTAFKPLAPRGAEVKRDQLTGMWYGDVRTDNGGSRRWLAHRKLDGTYTIDFVIINPDGSVSRQSEFGDWGVCGNYLVTHTRGFRDRAGRTAAEKASSYYWDVYQILRFDAKEELTYQNVSSGNKYSVRRVDSSFSLPTTPDQTMPLRQARGPARPTAGD